MASRVHRARRITSAGAFPSACGKTNLAMLVRRTPCPAGKSGTVGDDNLCWLQVGSDGQLRAINLSGILGVGAGTNRKTNCNATT